MFSREGVAIAESMLGAEFTVPVSAVSVPDYHGRHKPRSYHCDSVLRPVALVALA